MRHVHLLFVTHSVFLLVPALLVDPALVVLPIRRQTHSSACSMRLATRWLIMMTLATNALRSRTTSRSGLAANSIVYIRDATGHCRVRLSSQ